jgi:endogenous inhibitor of DNA gyrase (YacG/DUF329 family)
VQESHEMKEILVACPICKKKFNYYDSDFRPFCSEQCRLIDLGQWLNESYTVPVEKLTEDETQTLEKILDEKQNNEESES